MTSIQTIARLDGSGTEIRYSQATSFQKDFEIKGLSLKYVLKGEERYTLNGSVIRLRAGEYFLVNSAVEASVRVDSQQVVEGLCIDLDDDMLKSLGEVFGYRDGRQLSSRSDMLLHKRLGAYTEADEALGRAAKIALEGGSSSMDDLRDLFFSLGSHALNVQQDAEQRMSGLNVLRTDTSHHLMRQLLEAKDYLSIPSNGAISIADVASAVGLSEFHFIRLFKQAFGITPYKYGVLCRLRWAGQMLQAGRLPTEVAFEAGFQDVSSFSRAFVHQFGMPPSKFASAK